MKRVKQKKQAGTAVTPMAQIKVAKLAVSESVTQLMAVYNKALQGVEKAYDREKLKHAKQNEQLKEMRVTLKRLRDEAKGKKGKTVQARIDKLADKLDVKRSEAEETKQALNALKDDKKLIEQEHKKSNLMTKAADKVGKEFISKVSKRKVKPSSKKSNKKKVEKAIVTKKDEE